MVSPELLRRFTFFAEFGKDYMKTLATSARRMSVEENHWFFHPDEDIDSFFLVVEGQIGITHTAPSRHVQHGVANQLVGSVETEDVVVSTVDRGEVFGWSSLLPPYRSTAGAKSLTSSEIVIFDAQILRQAMEVDSVFGFILTQHLAQVVRGRLTDRQIECVASESG